MLLTANLCSKQLTTITFVMKNSAVCYMTPFSSSSALLDNIEFQPDISIAIDRPNDSLRVSHKLTYLRVIQIVADDSIVRLSVEMRPLYIEEYQRDFAIDKSNSMNPLPECSFELSVNRQSLIAQFKLPSSVYMANHSYGYIAAQHALSVLVAWGSTHYRGCRYNSIVFGIDDSGCDLEPVLQSLGFDVSYYSINGVLHGICEKGNINKLFCRNTSEFLDVSGIDKFVNDLKMQRDDSINNYRIGEQKIRKIKKDNDVLVEVLHGRIDSATVLLVIFLVVIIVQGLVIFF